MDVVKLAKYLNQISQCEEHYDNLLHRVQKAYQQKASWIIDFFIANGWACVEGAKNTEQQVQPDNGGMCTRPDIVASNCYIQRTDGRPICIDCINHHGYMHCTFNLVRTAYPLSCNNYLPKPEADK